MNKDIKRIVSVLFAIAVMASMFSVVFATDGNKVPKPGAVSTFDKLIGAILGIVQVVGYGFAVGMLLYVGIKYMMASANEKADLKKGAINYVIGAIVVFGATTIVTLIQNFSNDNVATAVGE